jgi:hypothetical protein
MESLRRTNYLWIDTVNNTEYMYAVFVWHVYAARRI